jgi:hypothetical protein
MAKKHHMKAWRETVNARALGVKKKVVKCASDVVPKMTDHIPLVHILLYVDSAEKQANHIAQQMLKTNRNVSLSVIFLCTMK